jgi:hypothetical protein
MYGISQNPNTKDYIMVFQSEHCKKCCEKYTNLLFEWCKSCQIDYLKQNFTNWTSENEKIDDFIREQQLRINDYNSLAFEWIPYNQFNNIKEISKDDSSILYSTVWKDGPLNYNDYTKKWMRESDKEVVLKYLNNSQNITNEFLNEV